MATCTACARRALLGGGLVLVASLWAAPTAHAACTISTTSLNFGTYDVFATTPDDSTGTITFRCGNTDFDISISLGPGGAGSFSPRRMSAGADRLSYNIYIDANRTSVWGDGAGGTVYFTRHNPQNNRDITLPFYGRIPSGQDAAVGSYSDTVVLTINF